MSGAIPNPSYKGPETNLSSADVMDLVLHAISAPGAPSLRYFRTRLARRLDWDVPGYITRAAVSRVEKHFAHLEELTLELDAGDAESTANLLHLIAAASRVRTLRIRLHQSYIYKTGPPIDSLLTDYLDSIPHYKPQLHTLLIYTKAISEASLLRLMSNSLDTLTRLDLCAHLTGSSWTALLNHLQEAPFRALRRFSMFACSDGPGKEMIAFCPLWQDWEAHSEALGVDFWFLRGRTAKTPRFVSHITGVVFDAGGEDGAARARGALRALVEHSHRCPRENDPGLECTKPGATSQEAQRIVRDEDKVSGLWTGLSRGLRS